VKINFKISAIERNFIPRNGRKGFIIIFMPFDRPVAL
jgi:hypothetical protein